MTGPGRVGSRVTHRLQNVGRVESGPEKVTRVHLRLPQLKLVRQEDKRVEGKEHPLLLAQAPESKILYKSLSGLGVIFSRFQKPG